MAFPGGGTNAGDPDDLLRQLLSKHHLASPTCFSSLTHAYDTLWGALWQNQCLTTPLPSLEETFVIRQADLLRALRLTCRLLLEIRAFNDGCRNKAELYHPSGPSAHGICSQHDPKKQSQRDILESTLRRCDLLMEILRCRHDKLPKSQHALLRLMDEGDLPLVAKKDTDGMYHYSFTDTDTGSNGDPEHEGEDDDEEDGIIPLTLDREALEEEENMLIRMASTPIPNETAISSKSNHDARPTDLRESIFQLELQQQIQIEWSLPVYEDARARKRVPKKPTAPIKSSSE